jgi:hypothetical protein
MLLRWNKKKIMLGVRFWLDQDHKTLPYHRTSDVHVIFVLALLDFFPSFHGETAP